MKLRGASTEKRITSDSLENDVNALLQLTTTELRETVHELHFLLTQLPTQSEYELLTRLFKRARWIDVLSVMRKRWKSLHGPHGKSMEPMYTLLFQVFPMWNKRRATLFHNFYSLSFLFNRNTNWRLRGSGIARIYVLLFVRKNDLLAQRFKHGLLHPTGKNAEAMLEDQALLYWPPSNEDFMLNSLCSDPISLVGEMAQFRYQGSIDIARTIRATDVSRIHLDVDFTSSKPELAYAHRLNKCIWTLRATVLRLVYDHVLIPRLGRDVANKITSLAGAFPQAWYPVAKRIEPYVNKRDRLLYTNASKHFKAARATLDLHQKFVTLREKYHHAKRQYSDKTANIGKQFAAVKELDAANSPKNKRKRVRRKNRRTPARQTKKPRVAILDAETD